MVQTGELDCLRSVVDPSENGVNKHRYVCAINDDEIRSSLRNSIQVVPLLYIRRSVLIMEPASATTTKARSRDEKAKFTAELKAIGGKRKRQQKDIEDNDDDTQEGPESAKSGAKKAKTKTYGRKEPNPLSMKKKKKENGPQQVGKDRANKTEAVELEETRPAIEAQAELVEEASGHKRRRKHKSKTAGAASKDGDVQVENSVGDE